MTWRIVYVVENFQLDPIDMSHNIGIMLNGLFGMMVHVTARLRVQMREFIDISIHFMSRSGARPWKRVARWLGEAMQELMTVSDRFNIVRIVTVPFPKFIGVSSPPRVPSGDPIDP
jgi:hypothetical protein